MLEKIEVLLQCTKRNHKEPDPEKLKTLKQIQNYRTKLWFKALTENRTDLCH